MSAEDRECLFSPCNDQGALQTFNTVAVQKIVATSTAKRDELYKTLSETEIFAHKSCYCKYTSKSRNNEQKKRKDALAHTVVSKRQQAKYTGGVRTDDRLATCPPRHRYDNACVPPKDSECLWYAVHTRLSRPPTLSDCMPSAMERSSALDRPHTSSRHDAHSHEFPGLHRNIDEIIWRGGSYERSVWLHHQHHQWEGLDQCSTGIASYNRSVVAEFLLKWGEDIPGAERLPGGSQRTPDWETMGGLPHQAYTDCAHVLARIA